MRQSQVPQPIHWSTLTFVPFASRIGTKDAGADTINPKPSTLLAEFLATKTTCEFLPGTDISGYIEKFMVALERVENTNPEEHPSTRRTCLELLKSIPPKGNDGKFTQKNIRKIFKSLDSLKPEDFSFLDTLANKEMMALLAPLQEPLQGYIDEFQEKLLKLLSQERLSEHESEILRRLKSLSIYFYPYPSTTAPRYSLDSYSLDEHEISLSANSLDVIKTNPQAFKIKFFRSLLEASSCAYKILRPDRPIPSSFKEEDEDLFTSSRQGLCFWTNSERVEKIYGGLPYSWLDNAVTESIVLQLVHGDKVPANSGSYQAQRQVLDLLLKVIPRQLFHAAYFESRPVSGSASYWSILNETIQQRGLSSEVRKISQLFGTAGLREDKDQWLKDLRCAFRALKNNIDSNPVH